MKFYIKLICGFRQDQEYTISADEAHKAYWLFANPEARAFFADGLAIKGSDIQRIVPDYQTTMGWNVTHRLDSDDLNEIHQNGVMGKMQNILASAKEVARVCAPEDLQTPLPQLLKEKYDGLLPEKTERGGGFKKLVASSPNKDT